MKARIPGSAFSCAPSPASCCCYRCAFNHSLLSLSCYSVGLVGNPSCSALGFFSLASVNWLGRGASAAGAVSGGGAPDYRGPWERSLHWSGSSAASGMEFLAGPCFSGVLPCTWRAAGTAAVQGSQAPGCFLSLVLHILSFLSLPSV